MRNLPKIGDWVFIKSAQNIQEFKFKETFGIFGIFGKVIEISDKRYSSFSGKKISPEIIVRAYLRDGICHLKTRKERIELYEQEKNNIPRKVLS